LLQGRVHNPTGEGVRAVSAQVQAKAAKVAATTTTGSTSSTSASSSGGSDGAKYSNTLPAVVANGSGGGGGDGAASNGGKAANANADDSHETKVKEGTAKRNIVRKKTSGSDSGNYNSCHKKQGGHGKGQWKDNMDPSYVETTPIDEKDPLYDELDGKFILSSSTAVAADPASGADPRGYDPGTAKAVYGPMLTETEFKHQVGLAVLEYFDSADSEEFIRNLLELKCEEYSASVVKKAVSLALDKGPRERESVSRLLTVLHPIPLADTEMERGFTMLLDSLDDLQTDVPEAHVSSGSGGCTRSLFAVVWTRSLMYCSQRMMLPPAANDRVLPGSCRGGRGPSPGLSEQREQQPTGVRGD
jgi:MA3 domain